MVVDGISAAEAIAASLCWLARDRYGDAAMIGDVNLEAVGYWHRGNCRFCTKPMDELVTTYNVSNVLADQLSAFLSLSRPARAARIREAQEKPWYEQLD
jgi:hypothetical protein